MEKFHNLKVALLKLFNALTNLILNKIKILLRLNHGRLNNASLLRSCKIGLTYRKKYLSL